MARMRAGRGDRDGREVSLMHVCGALDGSQRILGGSEGEPGGGNCVSIPHFAVAVTCHRRLATFHLWILSSFVAAPNSLGSTPRAGIAACLAPSSVDVSVIRGDAPLRPHDGSCARWPELWPVRLQSMGGGASRPSSAPGCRRPCRGTHPGPALACHRAIQEEPRSAHPETAAGEAGQAARCQGDQRPA